MESLNLPSILSPDLGLLFWMLLAFLVVFVVLRKYGFPVIIQMVEERKNFIDESLKNAREANEKLAGIKSESERILKEARDKQAEILKEAMATRDSIVREAREQAQLEGQKLLDEARTQIQLEKDGALREIRNTVTDISIGIAEKLMRRQLSVKGEQELYIEQMLDEMIGKQ